MLFTLAIAGAVSLVMATGAYGKVRTEESLRPGSWSLLFEVERDFQLGAYEGFMLSCKRHSSESTALRLGLTFGLMSQSQDLNRETGGNTSGPTDLSASSFEFCLTALYIFYPSKIGRMNPFIGLGPSVGYELDDVSESGYALSAGCRGALGVEWFATDNISFVAEYGLSLNYVYRDSDETRDFERYERDDGSFVRNDRVSDDRDRWNRDINRSFELTSSSVQLGLSVYF
jgi:hypothetical protein